MLDQHDPSVLRLYEIEDLLNLLAGVAESVFHHLSSNMSLLVWKQYNSAALDISTF